MTGLAGQPLADPHNPYEHNGHAIQAVIKASAAGRFGGGGTAETSIRFKLIFPGR